MKFRMFKRISEAHVRLGMFKNTTDVAVDVENVARVDDFGPYCRLSFYVGDDICVADDFQTVISRLNMIAQ